MGLLDTYKTDKEYLAALEKDAAKGILGAQEALMFYHHGGDRITIKDGDKSEPWKND